jgi:tetratricopeptide (TPR) repeat protein
MTSLRIVAVGLSAVAMLAGGAVVLEGSEGLEPSRSAATSTAVLIESEVVSPSNVDAAIATLEERVRADDAAALDLARLGAAYLQKARGTADPRFYALAGRSFRRSLEAEPSHLSALLGMGELALARHDFSGALDWGRRARVVDRHNSTAWGVIGDAHIGAGRYAAGFHAYQRMVDLAPNLSSLARVSYARELTGDVAGAIVAMRRAAAAGAPIAENRAWTATQIGDLYFATGRLSKAAAHYRMARHLDETFSPALAGLGRVYAARGRTNAAIDVYQRVVVRLPLPQYVMALGDLYDVVGRSSAAARQYDVVVAQHELFKANGVLPDVEMTLFFADQGRDPHRALQLARAQYRKRQSIQVADALAWSLYRNGKLRAAGRVMKRALHLDTRDATMHYHAGMIAKGRGQLRRAAHHLSSALETNPDFSILYADRARQALSRLDGRR